MDSKRKKTMIKLREKYEAFRLSEPEAPAWGALTNEQKSGLIYIAARASLDRKIQEGR